MIYNAISYVECVARHHPDVAVEAHGDGYDYSALVWPNNDALSQAYLDEMRIMLVVNDLAARVRREASEARTRAMAGVLGTAEPTQIRAYDEKYAEAVAHLADPSMTPTGLAAEAAETGESVAALAQAVVTQYDAAKDALYPIYGGIEGVRRQTLAMISTMMTFADLDALPEAVWPI